jgi:hypothetical protein
VTPAVARALVLGTTLLAGAACGYYNGMWSADHFAGQARKQEREGRMEEARASWATAAMRAESVVTRHPRGRWAPAALVLEGEALAKSGTCDRAVPTLSRALESVRTGALRERAALAAAECALAVPDLKSATRLLAPVTESRDAARAARARLLSGRAAELNGDLEAAAQWYARSSERGAVAARARVELAAGQQDAAVALLDTISRGRFEEAEWTALLGDLGGAASADVVSAALDRLLVRRRVPAGARARLLLADGDRLFAAASLPAAAKRYAQAAAIAPDSTAGQRGRVAELRVVTARAESLADLRAVDHRLGTILESGWGGDAAAEGRELQRRLRHVLGAGDAPEAGEAAQFHAAEFVRDSLAAPRLAAHLFLAFAGEHRASLFAPKAVLAAAGLAPERADSLVGVLQSAYAASPYTLALLGAASPGYAAVEDSLARALGVTLVPVEQPFAPTLILPPAPGPRGPPLDPREPARADQPRARPRRDEPERRRAPPPKMPPAPSPAERP